MPPCDEVFHVRRARSGDAQAIASVHVETWRKAYRDLLPASYLGTLSVERRAEFWSHELEIVPPERRPWVAETQSDGIVGFVTGGAARDEDVSLDTGEVYAIYVLPECWERGLGRTLLAHVERDLRDHGYSDAVLWVLADNGRARAFYEQLGWQADGATKAVRFGDQPTDEVRYRVSLDAAR